MTKVRIHIGMSTDGYSAGADQSLENPLGVRGPEMMGWYFPTKVFRDMHGSGGGETGIDNQAAERSMAGMGAWILGRNMFGPIRGPWPNDEWKGWWGEEPPYHVPTFVLTNHARETVHMKGGTSFYFITGGIHEALDRAREVAGGKDIRIGGGVSTIRQYLQAGLVDEFTLAVTPTLLGRGEELFHGIDMRALGWKVVDSVMGERAMHVVMHRK